MQGRLHHTLLAEFALLDAVRTRVDDPDGAGTLTGGFDDDFGEIVVFTTPGRTRASAREDRIEVVPCNVGGDAWAKLQQFGPGNNPDFKVTVVVHAGALRRARLVNEATGEPLIRTSDRLVMFRDRCRRVAYKFRSPLFVTAVEPSFGIGQRPSLFIFTCEDRENFAKG